MPELHVAEDPLAFGAPCPPVNPMCLAEAWKDAMLVLMDMGAPGFNPMLKQLEALSAFREAYAALSMQEGDADAAMWRFSKLLKLYLDLAGDRAQAGKYLLPTSTPTMLKIDSKVVGLAAEIPLRYGYGITWKDLLDYEQAISGDPSRDR